MRGQGEGARPSSVRAAAVLATYSTLRSVCAGGGSGGVGWGGTRVPRAAGGGHASPARPVAGGSRLKQLAALPSCCAAELLRSKAPAEGLWWVGAGRGAAPACMEIKESTRAHRLPLTPSDLS